MIDRLLALERTGVRLGLENITRLCDALGHPERSFASIHVAGTNGKGSVAAMVHAALVAAGLRAARYTSPHLVDLRERIVIGAEPVEAAALERAAGRVLEAAGPHTTFFEATTAAAFDLFRESGVQVAVVEVGLGGRFDATNVLEPAIGAITSIGFDHQQYLGDTLEAIAFEKAGIIKPGMTVVVGTVSEAARAVIARAAAERGAQLVDAAMAAHVEGTAHDGRATLFIETPDDRYGPLTLALRGEHQTGNALVAIRVLEAVRSAGIWLGGTAIERGLTSVVWPARLELIALETAGGERRRVLIDAAHNVDGARALASYLTRWHPERPALLFAAMQDKDVDGMLDALLPAVSAVVCTAPAMERAMPPTALAARAAAAAARRGIPVAVHAEGDPVAALDAALVRGETVCVAGSLFLAGAIREPLLRRGGVR